MERLGTRSESIIRAGVIGFEMKRNRRRWIVWAGLGLMLLAILAYVLSFDEGDPDMVPYAIESVDQDK